MKNTWIVCKNELIRYFTSPLAYVYLIAFLILNGSFALYFGHFFDRGQANLISMFSYQPWLYLLFLPGISMRLWAEEFRTKTIIQIMTMPVSTSNLVLGKFFASWLFCGAALILTFPFWITVNILGNPDNAVILISYIGSFLIAGCMLSISQTMSALSKNQVTALVLAVVANLIFMLCGLEYILSFFRLFAPVYIIDMIASFSFDTHFFNITQGLFELRDIIYFFSIIFLFNLTTLIIINFRTSGSAGIFASTSRGYYILSFIIMLLGFIGINLLANNYTRSWQYDFTEEKVFALTKTTKQILKNLPEAVTAKLYYSPELGRRNPEYRLMFDKVRMLLKQYAELSNGKFNYQIYNPQAFSNAEDRAITRGLKALPLIDSNEAAYFGLTLSNSIDEYADIPFFALERQNFLEQDITENLYRLYHDKKNIGILSTLPVFDTVIANVASSRWEIINQIEKFYNLKSVSKPEEINNKLAALILIHPRDLSPEMISSIKKYTDNGGKVLAFLDVATDSTRIFAPVTEKFVSSDLSGLDKVWGFRFNGDMSIADLDNSLTVQVNQDNNNPNYTQDLLQFYIPEDGINHEVPETYNLKRLLVSSVATVSPLTDDNVLFIPLLKSGENSAAVSADWAQEAHDPNVLLRNFKKDNYAKIIAAHIISKSPEHPFQIIAVADTDLLYDTFWSRTINTNDGNIVVPIFDNVNFVLNALEVLIGEENLIELRGKSAKTRKFDTIEKIRKQARQDFTVKEQEIMQKMEKAKAGLKEIWSKKEFEGRETFTADELSIIANIRKELDRLRLDLRNIRLNLNQKTDQIDLYIKFINIYAIPLLILTSWLIIYLRRRYQQKTNMGYGFAVNKAFILLLSFSLIMLIAGLYSVHQTNQGEIDVYENKPLFPNLAQEINDVTTVTLQSYGKQLTFRKQDNEWVLEGEPKLMVMQDRMRSFLSALIEARYYEKKSDRAENLSHFGLQSIQIKDSPNIRVELSNQQGEKILSFEVGKFDIEIGRGTRAAYIKFDNKFQVWLAAIELIDLSAEKKDWTLSRLWDLRFGRLLNCNNNTDINTLANLAKYLLNTQIINSTDNLENPEPLFTLKLQVEGNEKIDLSFWQKENKYYVSYKFVTIPKETNLNHFASYMQGNYYEIKQENMEQIRYVYEEKISDNGTN